MGDFNRATRAAKQVLPVMTYSANGTSILELPQTGYLGAINLLLKGSVTAASASTTTAALWPVFPLGLIKRITLRTNEGAEIWSTSGMGAYLYSRAIRSGFDVATNHSDYLRSGGVDPYGRYFANNGDIAASTTETFRAALRLPLAWGEMNLTGLLLLQNPGVRFTLEITWGDAATANGGLWSAITGTITAGTITVTPQLELYHLPASSDDDPNLAFAKTVIEDTKAFTGTGDQTYNPPMGNIYNRIIQEWVNGGAAPFSPADITGFKVSFAQTQVVYTEDADIKLFDQRRLYGHDLPEGVYVHEFSLPNGFPELPGGRDQFDTSQITDMSVVGTIASTATVSAGSYIRNIREQLVTVQG